MVCNYLQANHNDLFITKETKNYEKIEKINNIMMV